MATMMLYINSVNLTSPDEILQILILQVAENRKIAQGAEVVVGGNIQMRSPSTIKGSPLKRHPSYCAGRLVPRPALPPVQLARRAATR